MPIFYLIEFRLAKGKKKGTTGVPSRFWGQKFLKTGFGTTFVLFFLAEMGDKTQLATVALGAHFQDAFWVTVGTTLGMLIADVPAIFIGNKLSEKLKPAVMRRIAAVVFAAFAVLTYLGM